MMIETVYRTRDGEIFSTKKEAKEYLAEEERLDSLVEYLRQRFVREGDCIKDVLIVLSEDYDIVRRT